MLFVSLRRCWEVNSTYMAKHLRPNKSPRVKITIHFCGIYVLIVTINKVFGTDASVKYR